MKKGFLIPIIVLLCLSSSAYSQSIGSIISASKSNPYYQKDAQAKLKAGEIDKALVLYDEAIEDAKARRIGGKGVDGDLLAEYAYTLALHHNFEAALINIDRARFLEAKYKDFYSAQILKAMGHDWAAEQFMNGAKIPEWIAANYQNLTSKYAISFLINQDEPDVALDRANKLAANCQPIQAIVLFDELAESYPDNYIIYIDYSTVWESLKMYESASKLLKIGIDMITPNNFETLKTKTTLEKHLDETYETWRKYTSNTWAKKIFGAGPPKLMTYAGASFASGTFSLNGRIGAYTSKKFSGSLNLGLSFASELVMGNIGISAYKGWGIFLVGLGLTDSFSKGSNSIGLSPQVGLSVLNKNQTASFDFTIGCQIPFSAQPIISYSISIGETVYIDVSNKNNKKN